LGSTSLYVDRSEHSLNLWVEKILNRYFSTTYLLTDKLYNVAK